MPDGSGSIIADIPENPLSVGVMAHTPGLAAGRGCVSTFLKTGGRLLGPAQGYRDCAEPGDPEEAFSGTLTLSFSVLCTAGVCWPEGSVNVSFRF